MTDADAQATRAEAGQVFAAARAIMGESLGATRDHLHQALTTAQQSVSLSHDRALASVRAAQAATEHALGLTRARSQAGPEREAPAPGESPGVKAAAPIQAAVERLERASVRVAAEASRRAMAFAEQAAASAYSPATAGERQRPGSAAR